MEPNTLIEVLRNAGEKGTVLLIGLYFLYRIGLSILPRLRRPSRTASGWIFCLFLILFVVLA